MAQTKTETKTGANAAVRAAAIAARAPMRAFDPKDPNITEKVPLRIPVDRVNAGNGGMVVGLNGVFYTIQRGKETKVPKAVAAIVRQSLEQDDKTVQFMESLPTDSAPAN